MIDYDWPNPEAEEVEIADEPLVSNARNITISRGANFYFMTEAFRQSGSDLRLAIEAFRQSGADLHLVTKAFNRQRSGNQD